MIATAMLFYAISRGGGPAPFITIVLAAFVDLIAYVSIGVGLTGGCP